MDYVKKKVTYDMFIIVLFCKVTFPPAQLPKQKKTPAWPAEKSGKSYTSLKPN